MDGHTKFISTKLFSHFFNNLVFAFFFSFFKIKMNLHELFRRKAYTEIVMYTIL